MADVDYTNIDCHSDTNDNVFGFVGNPLYLLYRNNQLLPMIT